MKTIDCKVGIFDTEYQLKEHKDGSVTVIRPFVRWRNNSGSLDFTKIKEAGKNAEIIKRFFKDDALWLDDVGSLDDILDGNIDYNKSYIVKLIKTLGMKLETLSILLNVPYDTMLSYSSGRRSMPQELINKIEAMISVLSVSEKYSVMVYDSNGKEIYSGKSNYHSGEEAAEILRRHCGVDKSIETQPDKGAVNCWSYECYAGETDEEKEIFPDNYTVEFK
ncbi:MAG: hypothetical protein WCI51_20460 [Lentisphaerota bacterium]